MVLAMVLAAPAPSPAEKIVLKAITFTTSTRPTDQYASLAILMDLINKRAKGELVIKDFGGPAAIPIREQPQALKNGVVDVLMTASVIYASLAPAGQILSLSKIPSAAERESGAHDLLIEEHKKANMFYLGRVPNDEMVHVLQLRKKRVVTPYDLAGMKCGGTNPQAKTVADALNMNFVKLAMPDRYTAMERGLVDAVIQPIDSAAHWKMYEVDKYIIDPPFFRDNATFTINLDTWNNLPKHLQTLIWKCYLEAEPKILRIRKEDPQIARKLFIDNGVEFIKFSSGDVKWFINQIFTSEGKRMKQKYPDIAPQLLKLLQD